ncbi:hypothetical protein PR048_030994 [Dryococelus australis]|uniref:Uncharacterized protein n=1 Tax=Dryococelus australis TaxID=614101 RepID=A0ABQ9G425_9NEOP|nr:hypothetical protein PR048_030994 [Dryococelus australis]
MFCHFLKSAIRNQHCQLHENNSRIMGVDLESSCYCERQWQEHCFCEESRWLHTHFHALPIPSSWLSKTEPSIPNRFLMSLPVGHFRHTAQVTKILRAGQVSVGVPQHRLFQDEPASRHLLHDIVCGACTHSASLLLAKDAVQRRKLKIICWNLLIHTQHSFINTEDFVSCQRNTLTWPLLPC